MKSFLAAVDLILGIPLSCFIFFPGDLSPNIITLKLELPHMNLCYNHSLKTFQF